VAEAEDGPSAFETAVRLLPDLMLVDIGLAGFDGYELARRLRTMPETKAAVLVALTGYGRPEDVARSLAAGFDHHAVKPLAPDAPTTDASLCAAAVPTRRAAIARFCGPIC